MADYQKLVVSWDPFMILLSYGISFVGSYIGVSLCEQYRQSRTNPYKHFVGGIFPTGILLLMSLTIGGVAVWCMHFVGMTAVVLKTSENHIISKNYDFPLTIASNFAVIGSVFFGLLIASRDRAFTKTKEELLGMIVDDARKSGIRITSKFSVILLASIKGIGTLMVGGLVTASGVCAMHYLGVMSMRFDGHMEWDAGVIAASVAIAFVVSTIAFWILFRLLALYPYMEWLRVVSAAVMGVAVSSMHYTGIYGAKYYYDPTRTSHADNVVTSQYSYRVSLMYASVVSVMLVIVVIRDMRNWNRYCSDLIRKTDEIFERAARAPNSNVGQFLEKYREVRGRSFVELQVISLSESKGIEAHDIESHNPISSAPPVRGGIMSMSGLGFPFQAIKMEASQGDILKSPPAAAFDSARVSARTKTSNKVPVRAPAKDGANKVHVSGLVV